MALSFSNSFLDNNSSLSYTKNGISYKSEDELSFECTDKDYDEANVAVKEMHCKDYPCIFEEMKPNLLLESPHLVEGLKVEVSGKTDEYNSSHNTSCNETKAGVHSLNHVDSSLCSAINKDEKEYGHLHSVESCNGNLFENLEANNGVNVFSIKSEVSERDAEASTEDADKLESRSSCRDGESISNQTEDAPHVDSSGRKLRRTRRPQNKIKCETQMVKTQLTSEVTKGNLCNKTYSCHSQYICKQRSSLVCGTCGKVFITKYKLDRHTRTHTNERPYCCTLCGKAYRVNYQLQEHFAQHLMERVEQQHNNPFVCYICGKSYKQKQNLNEHVQTHTSGRPSCDICGKSCKGRRSLLEHVRTHTIGQPTCAICKKSFALKGDLTKHMLVHTEEGKCRTFRCNICARAFIRKKDLNKHLRKHVNSSPFHCAYCGKSFSDKFCLKIHVTKTCRQITISTKHSVRKYSVNKDSRTRDDLGFSCNKLYQKNQNSVENDCKTSGKTIINAVSCISDIETFSNDHSFICEYCGKSFKLQGYLKTHISVQHNDGAFRCDICDKSFKTKGGIAIHIADHIGLPSYSCGFCGVGFSFKRSLECHIKHHLK